MKHAGESPAPSTGPDIHALERAAAGAPITSLEARALLRAGLVEWHTSRGWRVSYAGLERLDVLRSGRR
jgi:hypothetical protein